MTSKYNHKIDINRYISIEALKNILEQLKNGVFLEFLKFTREEQLERVFLSIVAYGYISDTIKYIKLTNIQRRQLIREIDLILLNTVEGGTHGYSIHLIGNEYINSLPFDDWI
jgi:hypothetical protein